MVGLNYEAEVAFYGIVAVCGQDMTVAIPILGEGAAGLENVT